MRGEVVTDDAVLTEPAKVARPSLQLGKAMRRYWCEVVVVAIALLLWLPRLTGPIDLRWDAGVYYVLGTSLAQGHGYRILSEPGAPEALQYPPLLSAVVALYQRAVGSSDPTVVGFYLRISYAMLYIVYALAVFALAKRYAKPGWAVVAAALCLLHFETVFLSDLLFAELPFALVSVVFALIASDTRSMRQSWRECTLFGLAAVGFALRTAGVVLLAAWALEPVFRRRWGLVLGRCAIAVLPIIGWQTYVARVRASNEYAHPAYQYQRASYQYYNVSYADNVRLLDPFRPELGPITPSALGNRLVTNLPSILASLGEGVSTRNSAWQDFLESVQRHLVGKSILPKNFTVVPIFGLTALVLAGLIILVRRGAWLMILIIVGSVGLVWTTPWPAQFTRYLTPLGCFLSICAVLALSRGVDVFPQGGKARVTSLGRALVAALLALILGSEIYTTLKMFHFRTAPEALVVSQRGQPPNRLFVHDQAWQAWEKATLWIDGHVSPDAVIATTAPHLLYLRTGRHAVLPPMESDPEKARRLLEAVPVSHVIVDELEFLDVSRRYARPAVETDPIAWRRVYSVNDTSVYEHTSTSP